MVLMDAFFKKMVNQLAHKTNWSGTKKLSALLPEKLIFSL
jgi:hypothetical protein